MRPATTIHDAAIIGLNTIGMDMASETPGAEAQKARMHRDIPIFSFHIQESPETLEASQKLVCLAGHLFHFEFYKTKYTSPEGYETKQRAVRL